MKKEWLYIPNLVGYLRLFLLVLFLVSDVPLHKAIYMTVSLIADVFDGKIARLLNQSTLFGSRLDLVIDMVSRVLLSGYLVIQNEFGWVSLMLILCSINDMICYTTSIVTFYGNINKTKINHKEILKRTGYLLPIYYSTIGLGTFNVLSDAYLLFQLYCPPFITSAIIYVTLAGYLFRQLSVLEQTLHISSVAKRIAYK